MKNHFWEERVLEPLRYFMPFTVVLYLVFILLRGYELFAFSLHHALPENFLHLAGTGLLWDFVFSLQLSAVLIVFFGLFNYFHKKLGRIYSLFFLLLFLLVYLAVIQYFVTTSVPLGADFWGYSADDIKTTVQASGGIDWKSLLLFGAVILVVVVLYQVLMIRDFFQNPVLCYSYLFLMSFSIPAWMFMPSADQFRADSHYFLAENKGRFFLMKSAGYFLSKYNRDDQEAGTTFSGEYPLMHTVDYQDVLGKYFNQGSEKPNLVFIQVEGLGRDFCGNGAMYGGFTPFLDSLSRQSLSWDNFLSTTGRTFGVMPSMYGSLPFGESGFMEMGTKMPDHQTLISLLEQQGYQTNFFYGGSPGFDNQDIFLEYQGIDSIIGADQFPARYRKMSPAEGGFSWGYGDRDVFEYSLEVTAGQPRVPRMDIYMTLTTHEPFLVPDPAFKTEFDKVLRKIPEKEKELYLKYRGVFECLLYTDDAIRKFISWYSNRPDFSNTIFIITGDHRMIPVPHKNSVSRFHVPFMIWSPLLKNARQIRGVGTHAGVAPTMMAFLSKNYGLKFPSEMPFLADVLDVSEGFRSKVNQPFMVNKGELSVYLLGDVFYYDGDIMRIRNNMEVTRLRNRELTEKAASALERFRKVNDYVCRNNKLFKKTSEFALGSLKAYELPDSAQEILLFLGTDTMSIDDKFFLARDIAFDKKYDTAEIILKHVLNLAPNYADVRILLGRTYMWRDDSLQARRELREALRRSPNYYDAYVALIDCEILFDNLPEAERLTRQGLAVLKDEQELIERLKKLESLKKQTR